MATDPNIVVFDPAAFRTIYPTFINVPDAVLNNDFAAATIFLDNSDQSPVTDVGQRALLYNLIVAHIATLDGSANADGQPSGIVGPIKSASEGSVSVASALGDMGSDEAFWASSAWGWQYWQLTAPLRTAQYVPGPRPYLGVPSYGMGGRWVPSWGAGGAWPR